MSLSEINCYQPNISATKRLRVIDSTQATVSPFQNYLQNVCFLYAQKYLLDVSYRPLALDYTLSNKTGQIRAIIDTPINVLEFQKKFDRKIKNRSVILELTDELGGVEVINNYQAIDFTKTATSERTQAKTYELIFVPIKIKNQFNKTTFQRIIQILDCFPSAQSPIGILNSDIVIRLFDFCDPEIFSFGYSTTPNVSDILYNNFLPQNTIRSIPNGTYWFFAINTLCPKFYDSVLAIITNGTIIIDNPTATTVTYIISELTPNPEFNFKVNIQLIPFSSNQEDYEYGYSLVANAEIFNYQSSPIFNLNNPATYYFNVRKSGISTLLGSQSITLLKNNPLIITENETLTDQGFIVPE